MLIQSHGDVIQLLPALPDTWPSGKVTGLRARGGYEVDMQWKNGKLTQAVIRGVSNSTDTCKVMYTGKTRTIKIAKGKSKILKPEL